MGLPLTKNGKLLRLASGRIATKVAGEVCSCCDTQTCVICGEGNGFPALICPTSTGLTVTIAGVQLASTIEVPGDDLHPTWSTGSTLSGTFCLRNDGCSYGYVSKYPVTHAILDRGEDLPPLSIPFYLFLTFYCGSGSGEDDPRVVAIIQEGVGDGIGEGAIVTLFATEFDGGVGTGAPQTPWDRACPTGGYVVYNQMGAFGDRATGDDYAGGKNGTITTGPACSNLSCFTGCGDTSLMLDVSGGALAVGLAMMNGAVGSCGYSGTGGRYTANIVTADQPVGGGSYVVHQLRIYDSEEPGNPVIRDAYRVCSGDAGSVKGDYVLLASAGPSAEDETITIS